MSRTVLIVILVIVLLAGIAAAVIIYANRDGDGGENAGAENGIQLISTFVEGGAIPIRYTCDGENVSPSLAWSGIPQEAQSLALIVEDPDAPGGTFAHWAIFDIPSMLTGLSEGIEKSGTVPGVGVQGQNDFNEVGYGGPCPSQGSQHRYIFTLYALDQRLEGLQPGVPAGDLQAAMKGHVLAQGQLTGNYGR